MRARNIGQASAATPPPRTAGDLPALSADMLDAVERLYDERIRKHVHGRW